MRKNILICIFLAMCILTPMTGQAAPKKQVTEIENNTKIQKKPKSKGFNVRVTSSFDNEVSKFWAIGAGLHFHRSFFQFGIEGGISSNFSPYDGLSDRFTGIKNPITNQYRLNSETRELVSTTSFETIEKVKQEYIYPLGQLVFVPGVNFKYVSLECALGISFNDCVRMEHLDVFDSQGMLAPITVYEGTNSFEKYFVARPSLSVYVPLSREHHGISLSAGYEFVVGAQQALNGWVFSLGGFWSL